MASKTAIKAMEGFLSRLPQSVSSQLTVVPAHPQRQFLLHLSKDTKIREFAPYVTPRTLPDENRSIPRISTAPTLAGCIMGYCSDLEDFKNRPGTYSGDRKRKVPFTGGWVVYGIPYELALQPSKKLLPDSGRTNEHWLVSYDENTVSYPAVPIAKVFYQSVSYVATEQYPDVVIQVLIEVLSDTPLQVDSKTVLEKGCWRLQMRGLHAGGTLRRRAWNQLPKIEPSQLSRPEYMATKKLVASFLSHEDNLPPSAYW